MGFADTTAVSLEMCFIRATGYAGVFQKRVKEGENKMNGWL